MRYCQGNLQNKMNGPAVSRPAHEGTSASRILTAAAIRVEVVAMYRVRSRLLPKSGSCRTWAKWCRPMVVKAAALREYGRGPAAVQGAKPPPKRTRMVAESRTKKTDTAAKAMLFARYRLRLFRGMTRTSCHLFFQDMLNPAFFQLDQDAARRFRQLMGLQLGIAKRRLAPGRAGKFFLPRWRQARLG